MIQELWADNLLWRIFEQPLGWRLWILWLMLINTLSFAFLATREGRVTAMVWIGNVISMMSLYWLIGYERLLGLSHVIWWTPLLIWLAPRAWAMRGQGRLGVWLMLVVVSDAISLVIDYVDVARHFLE